MTDETEQFQRGDGKFVTVSSESTILGKSIRSILALIIMATLCFRELLFVVYCIYTGQPIDIVKEPLYGIAYFAAGYFFNQSPPGGNKNDSRPGTKT